MDHTQTFRSLLSPAQLQYLSTNTPVYYTPRPSLVPWLPDYYFALAAPVIVYWVASLFFHVLDTSDWKWLDKYRLHDSAEMKARNLATRMQVIRAVLFQHFVQTVAGIWWMEVSVAGADVDHVGAMEHLARTLMFVARWTLGEKTSRRMLETNGAEILYWLYWWAIPATKLLLGMFIIDTWQYFLHRGMHSHPYLYKKIHSVHHRLYVPYAFGALYNHPLEGFLLDSVGAGFAEAIVGLAVRETVILFSLSTLKTVDDHCGYNLPWDPLQIIFGNNADYHDIHHQSVGIKSNYSQPFFIHWDVLLGTRMTRKDMDVRRKKLQKAE
ncbi:sphingosine hydroxylase [Sparassis latifolia]